jgi:hypothetical protein
MQPSMFNVRVPLDSGAGHGDVFLMNTFTDAQLIVSREVADLIDRLEQMPAGALRRLDEDEREALETLAEQGFLVTDRGRA